VKNTAGGYTFTLEPFAQLSRFLILGTDSGSYYASERKLTIENSKVVDACLALDAARTVALIVEISLSGRAPKNDPAIVAIAIAASHPDPMIARMAFDHLEQVCRTATHLFTFVTLVHGRRGWGRGLKRAVGRWYTGKSALELAYQLTKYQARSKMSHRDESRRAQPVAQWVEHQQSLVTTLARLSSKTPRLGSKSRGYRDNRTPRATAPRPTHYLDQRGRPSPNPGLPTGAAHNPRRLRVVMSRPS